MPVALKLTWKCGSVEGGDQVFSTIVGALERLQRDLDSFEKVWPFITKAMERALAEHFGSEGSDDTSHGQWAPLSPKYKAWKDAHYPGAPIMVRSGNLKKALTDSAAAHAYRASNAQSMVFGTEDLPYATYHQEGTDHMPARPPIDFNKDEFEKKLMKAAQLGIVTAGRDNPEMQRLGWKVEVRELDSALTSAMERDL